MSVRASRVSTHDHGDPSAPLPLDKVQNAVVIEVNAQAMSSTDVLVFTGDASRTRENIRMLKLLLGGSRPRMIALVPDCKFSKEMKAQGVLVIQPSIALANIAIRMALLDKKFAEALSNEISTTSDFSTASYFLRADGGGHRGSVSEMSLDARRLALGRSVVNHQSVHYDRLMETLAAENLPMPPPHSRVAMFGTSAAEFDPFPAETTRRVSSSCTMTRKKAKRSS